MRIGQLLQIGFFLAFIFGGMVLILAFGGMESVSETENRALAALPKWSQHALLSGDYSRGFENYVADHVAFRDKLVDASMTVASWRGLAGADDTVIVASHANNDAENAAVTPPNQQEPPQSSTSDASASQPAAGERQRKTNEHGRLVGKVLITGNRAMGLYSYSPEAGKAYAEAINQFQEAYSRRLGNQVRVFTLLAPTAVEFVNGPALQKLSDSQLHAIDAVYRQLDPSVTPVDAVNSLRGHTGEKLYFRTDHHWTATGAYYAYEAFMKAQGTAPVPLARYEQENVTGFLGSLYSSTLSKKLEANPDTIVLYKPFVKHVYIVHYEGPLQMKLLDMHHAHKKNKYRIFLSGDRPWGKITTETGNNRRLAVIKDSYGNAFVPFLLPHYSEIYIIDPRQFHQSLLDFVQRQNINEVLFLNNAEATSHTGFTTLLRKLFTPAVQ